MLNVKDVKGLLGRVNSVGIKKKQCIDFETVKKIKLIMNGCYYEYTQRSNSLVV